MRLQLGDLVRNGEGIRNVYIFAQFDGKTNLIGLVSGNRWSTSNLGYSPTLDQLNDNDNEWQYVGRFEP